MGRENDLGGDEVRTVREGSFILGGQAGGVYSTAYREAIPETAKLAGTGNSQVLVLQSPQAQSKELLETTSSLFRTAILS